MKISKQKLIEILFNRPHIVESYFFCTRQFFLNVFGIYNQYNERLNIGRVLHDKPLKSELESIVKVDEIDLINNQIVEFKKNDFGIPAIMQTYIYLKKLNSLGVHITKGVIKSIEKRKKFEINYPDPIYENMWNEMLYNILNTDTFPDVKVKSKCKNCSLFDYCWID